MIDSLDPRITALAADFTPQDAPFVPGETPVPVSGKVIGARERAFMVQAALDGWLTNGRFNDAFEKKLCEETGLAHALTVNSGSSANLAALSAVAAVDDGRGPFRPGDEVITLAAGFPTTVAPVVQCGLTPVFVDVERDSADIDPRLLEAALSPKTRAVMVAHTLGNPFDLDAVAEFCRAHDLRLIEDCCDALGSTWNGRHVGTFGDVMTLSFYPAHHITTGEGGAVLTNDLEIFRAARSFRDWGRDCFCRPGQDNRCGRRFDQRHGDLPFGYDHKYVYSRLGYNLKMTDMQAACGLAQTERLADFARARRRNFALLAERLADCPHLSLPHPRPQADPSWFGMLLFLKESAPLSRLELLKKLDAARIGTRLLFAGNMVRQPALRGVPYRVAGSLEQTDRLMERAFWIGCWPGLTPEMLEYSAKILLEALR